MLLGLSEASMYDILNNLVNYSTLCLIKFYLNYKSKRQELRIIFLKLRNSGVVLSTYIKAKNLINVVAIVNFFSES